jgi:hypothetical protein
MHNPTDKEEEFVTFDLDKISKFKNELHVLEIKHYQELANFFNTNSNAPPVYPLQQNELSILDQGQINSDPEKPINNNIFHHSDVGHLSHLNVNMQPISYKHNKIKMPTISKFDQLLSTPNKINDDETKQSTFIYHLSYIFSF